MCAQQSSLIIDSDIIKNISSDDVILAFRELIRRALRENSLLTAEQFIHQTFDVNGLNTNQYQILRDGISFIFWCVQYLDTPININI